jgi:hypothetical protein
MAALENIFEISKREDIRRVDNMFETSNRIGALCITLFK